MKRRVAIIILCLLISIPILFGGWAFAEMTAAQKGAVGGGGGWSRWRGVARRRQGCLDRSRSGRSWRGLGQ